MLLRSTFLTALAAVASLASLGLGCASVFGMGPSKSREEAIAACVEAVPAETVPFGDAFAACMEEHGWVYETR